MFDQYDRQWAIRNRTTGQLVTAREQPRVSTLFFPSTHSYAKAKLIDTLLLLLYNRTNIHGDQLVLIRCSLDEKSNELRVSFPAGSGLEGFAVGLRTSLEEMGSWERRVSPSSPRLPIAC